MPRTNGLRKVGPAWKDWDRQDSRKPALVIPTPEQAAQIRAEEGERIARFFADAPPVENRATRKIEDMKARTAVEGNTDLNHDNVEGGE